MRVAVSVLLLGLSVIAGNELNDQKETDYWRAKGLEDINAALRVKLNEGVAKNVILFIGDGMGPNTITAARIFNGGESSQLFFETFPHTGLLKTYAADNTVPDSSCTATALFSGVKINMEVVGLNAHVKFEDCKASLDESTHLSNIIHWAQQAGKATGVVTTTRISHATPSSAYAHSASRQWECIVPNDLGCQSISEQLVRNEPGKSLNVIFGGGRQILTSNATARPNDPLDDWVCKREDGIDLISEWQTIKQNEGVSHAYIENTKQLRQLDTNVEHVLGIFGNSHLPYEDQRDKSDEGCPTLAEMTKKAIDVLAKNPNGYVLIVEGGMIDQAHHRGTVRRALTETVMFDEAIKLASASVDFKDSLVIVTSDHAHGLTINGKTNGTNDIFGITRPSKVDGVPFSILTYITGSPKAFPYKVVDGKIVRTDPSTLDTTKPDYQPQIGLVTDETVHGGVDVPVFALGPMAHLFHGVHEQSYVAYVISYAAGIGEFKDRPSFATQSKPMMFLTLLNLAIVIRYFV